MQAYSENLKSYLMSMGFVRLFDVINLTQVLLTIVFNYIFMYKIKLGLIGFSIAKFLTEVILVIIIYVAWKKHGDKESFLNNEKISTIFTSEYRFLVNDFLIFFLKCASQNYCDYIGWEALTIMLGAYGDQAILTAWVSIQNIMTITYSIGIGCGNSIRSFVGLKIGEQQHEVARKMSVVFLIWSLVISLVWALILGFFSSSIADLFTQLENNKKMVQEFVIVWGIISPMDVLWPCFIVIFKLINKTVICNMLSICTWVIIPPTFTYIGLFLLDMGGIASVYCYYPTMIISNGIAVFIIYFATDWNKIPSLKGLCENDFTTSSPKHTELSVLIKDGEANPN